MCPRGAHAHAVCGRGTDHCAARKRATTSWWPPPSACRRLGMRGHRHSSYCTNDRCMQKEERATEKTNKPHSRELHGVADVHASQFGKANLSGRLSALAAAQRSDGARRGLAAHYYLQVAPPIAARPAVGLCRGRRAEGRHHLVDASPFQPSGAVCARRRREPDAALWLELASATLGSLVQPRLPKGARRG